MSEKVDQGDVATAIGGQLPFLRRYARALTGSQSTGDKYAAATLEAILEDRSVFEGGIDPRVALFRVFNDIWVSTGSPVEEGGSDDRSPEARAQWRLAGLTKSTREALLLHSIEGFTVEEIGQIMKTSAEEAAEMIVIARSEMANEIRGKVMIIEDEALIAMDLTDIVEQMGHEVTGVARTRQGAVELAARVKPDLVLADIQLADKSSGIDAVNEILRDHGDIPVVFITAFPERLLTGERPEPAFLISKPYAEEQARSAISQAMFFAGTETLKAE